MKKLLILTALCCCPLLSYGQTDGFMKPSVCPKDIPR